MPIYQRRGKYQAGSQAHTINNTMMLQNNSGQVTVAGMALAAKSYWPIYHLIYRIDHLPLPVVPALSHGQNITDSPNRDS